MEKPINIIKMAKELKAGVYIAQGPETNILVRLVGNAPMLDVAGAIDLNSFYQKGEVRELRRTDVEVMDILSCPEKYRFELPSFSDSVKSEGITTTTGRTMDQVEESEYDVFTQKYKELCQIHKPDEVEVRFKLWLRQKHNIPLQNGGFIIKKIKQLLNKPLYEQSELD